MLQLSFVVKQKGVRPVAICLLVFLGSYIGLGVQTAAAASLQNVEMHIWQEGGNHETDPTEQTENEAPNSNRFRIPFPMLLVVALTAFLGGATIGLILLKASRKDEEAS